MPRLMFERPRRIEWEELGPRFGRMVAEPFEKGYALTVGNSLRRVLLSATPGAAIVWARIPAHTGGRLPGVQEDVTTLLLNLKRVTVRLAADAPVTARLSAVGPRAVVAGELEGTGLEVLTAEQPLATLEPGARLEVEVGVRLGRGYVSADRHAEPAPPGAIALDSAFSPIRRVNYTVEMSRLGNITDYEKLIVEVATDGSLTPDQALLRSAKLLRDHFDLFTPAGADEDDDITPEGQAVEARVPGEATKRS